MDGIAEIVIARPRAMVADVMFDVRNASLWATGVVSCTPLAPGPLRAGMRIEQVSKVAGVNTTIVYEIVAVEPGRFVELRITDPFEMWTLHELEDAAGGTLVRIRTKSVGGNRQFFRLFEPLLNWLTKRTLARDLRRLKRLVECGDRRP